GSMPRACHLAAGAPAADRVTSVAARGVDTQRWGIAGDGRRPSLTPVDRPIGMFDSGFGGLTVARAVMDLLPDEDLVYIGDTGRYPYGSKPLREVRRYAEELARSLVDEFDVKA